MLSVWDSLNHIKAFAGPNYLQPTIPPSHAGKVFDKDSAVHHYAINEVPPSLYDWTLSSTKQPAWLVCGLVARAKDGLTRGREAYGDWGRLQHHLASGLCPESVTRSCCPRTAAILSGAL